MSIYVVMYSFPRTCNTPGLPLRLDIGRNYLPERVNCVQMQCVIVECKSAPLLFTQIGEHATGRRGTNLSVAPVIDSSRTNSSQPKFSRCLDINAVMTAPPPQNADENLIRNRSQNPAAGGSVVRPIIFHHPS